MGWGGSLNDLLCLDNLKTNQTSYYNLPNFAFWGWLSMESQPQNPEFRNNPENFHPCIMNVDEDSDKTLWPLAELAMLAWVFKRSFICKLHMQWYQNLMSWPICTALSKEITVNVFKILNTSCLSKRPRQTAQIQNRLSQVQIRLSRIQIRVFPVCYSAKLFVSCEIFFEKRQRKYSKLWNVYCPLYIIL